MFEPSNEIILIVDDNPTNLAVLSQVLKESGYQTRFAMDGTNFAGCANARDGWL
jgi:CheY-like chemotaxis protein